MVDEDAAIGCIGEIAVYADRISAGAGYIATHLDQMDPVSLAAARTYAQTALYYTLAASGHDPEAAGVTLPLAYE